MTKCYIVLHSRQPQGEALQVHFLISARNYTRGCASYVTSSIRAELRQIQCPPESILHLHGVAKCCAGGDVVLLQQVAPGTEGLARSRSKIF